jgi:hypothetical protein
MGVYPQHGFGAIADAGRDNVKRNAVRERESGVRMTEDVEAPAW